MATTQKRMRLNDLDMSVFNNSFSTTPHPIFFLYDEDADEFIIKVKKPDSPTALFYLTDSSALVVSLNNNQVIGAVYFNFSKEYLPKLKNHGKHLVDRSTMHYQELNYEPEKNKGFNLTEVFLGTKNVVKRELVSV